MNPLRPQNKILKAMVYTNIFMFAVSLLFSRTYISLDLDPFSFLSPSTKVLTFLGASGVFPISQFDSWSSLITANWLHGSLLHIIFNVLALSTIVPMVIMVYGQFRMFTIYTIAGAGGFFASYMGNVNITIGASSGICGLIGSLLLFGYLKGGLEGKLMIKQVSGWVFSLVLIGVFLPNINNWGHFGGLFSGILAGFLCGYNDKRKEQLPDPII